MYAVRSAAAGLALCVPLLVSCKVVPPNVSIAGPESVAAGTEAKLSAEVSPADAVRRIKWSVEAAGAADGAVRLSQTTGDATTLSVAGEGGPKEVAVTLDVIHHGDRVASARKVIRVIHPERPPDPVWPSPLPPGWRVLDDYEAPGDPPANLWGGRVGTWGFKGGRCAMEAGKAAQGAMRITFAFPMQDSACGTWEYFASVKDRPQPVDISGYERIVFMARSGDGSAHKVRIEVVEFDPHAAYDQGIVADSEPFTIGPDWQRHEVALDKLLPEMFDRRKGRQVGLRIDRRDQAEAKGVVLVDNLTLAGKR